ncbi:hypothetical protein [Neobacillus drentensis]|uniref:hypothetical protein n=1 Tax=Neobacillus drentensis TaxID=220684 RepID=UPI003000E000
MAIKLGAEKAVAATTNATQTEVDKTLQKLQKAINGLQKKAQSGDKVNATEI